MSSSTVCNPDDALRNGSCKYLALPPSLSTSLSLTRLCAFLTTPSGMVLVDILLYLPLSLLPSFPPSLPLTHKALWLPGNAVRNGSCKYLALPPSLFLSRPPSLTLTHKALCLSDNAVRNGSCGYLVERDDGTTSAETTLL